MKENYKKKLRSNIAELRTRAQEAEKRVQALEEGLKGSIIQARHLKQEADILKAMLNEEQDKTLFSKILMVKAFNDAYKIPYALTPEVPKADKLELRANLLQEELDEFREACRAGDLVEIADALGDLFYLILGGVLDCGLATKFNSIFDEIQRSNMDKLHEGEIVKNEAGKVIKPEGWQPPQIANIIFNLEEE